MTRMLLDADEATPENSRWHELRRAGVTASEIAAVMGISPWDSRFSLHHRKLGGWEVEETDEMRAGKLAEPVIVQWFERRYSDKYVVRGAGLYANADRPWQLATPDGLVCLDRVCGACDVGVATPCTCFTEDLVAVLECKYVIHDWGLWGPEGTDDVPVHYRAQVLWQMDVLGVDVGYLVAWHGAEFRTYIIRRDERDLRAMRTAAAQFVEQLARDEAPPLDGHAATLEALKRLHPSIVDDEIEVDVEFAEGYRRARALRRRAEAMEDLWTARVRAKLGNAQRLVCGKKLVASRSIFAKDGDMAELDSLDADPAVVDRLNPGRAASYR